MSIAAQGHSGTVAECATCHNSSPLTLDDGPHGMHTVGQTWVEHHGSYEDNTAQCTACHGGDYRGSPLSKTFTARSFDTNWGVKRFDAGHAIGCFDCHNGPGGE